MLELLELVSVSTVLSSSVLDRLALAWNFLRSLSRKRLLCRLYRRIWLTLAWSLASSILNGGFFSGSSCRGWIGDCDGSSLGFEEGIGAAV